MSNVLRSIIRRDNEDNVANSGFCLGPMEVEVEVAAEAFIAELARLSKYTCIMFHSSCSTIDIIPSSLPINKN
jgi:hypothetical protein